MNIKSNLKLNFQPALRLYLVTIVFLIYSVSVLANPKPGDVFREYHLTGLQ